LQTAPENSRVALITLGSNLGDSVAHVQRAFVRLRDLAGGEFRHSSLWRSTPVDCPPGSPEFINAAAAFTVLDDETPESLLTKLRAMEKELGRQPKKILNEPRILDLDLIAFGNEERHTADLILPHPRAHTRRFVLAPLAEIVPDFRLPGSKWTIRELLAQAPEDPGLSPLS
jgi:2-amino-4-hydroxy-6-hydroxymethyldihydropteridine diphosphokinase